MRSRCRLLLALSIACSSVGCERLAESLDNTADAMTGNQAVEERSELQNKIDEIQNRHEERLREALPDRGF